MSVVQYGDAVFSILQTQSVECPPEFSTDGTTYLWNHWTHTFVALFEGMATSYQKGDTAQLPGLVAVAGRAPHISLVALRDYLSQPRRRYRWFMGADVVIDSPGTKNIGVPAEKPFACDLNNGPVVSGLVVTQIAGYAAWVVQITIETWISGCPNAPVMLSHRWKPSSTINEQHLAIRTIEGEAVFNLKELARLAQGADDFRINFGHSVPDHFQRTGVEVALSPDGKEVHYQIVDEEQAMNIGLNCPAVSVDVKEEASWEGSGVSGYVAGAAGGLIDFFVRRAEFGTGPSTTRTSRRGTTITRGAQAPASLTARILSGAKGASGSLPRWVHQITVSAIGNRLSTKATLLRYALQVAFNRVGQFSILQLAPYKIEVAFDLTGKQVDLVTSFSGGVVAALTGAVFANLDFGILNGGIFNVPGQIFANIGNLVAGGVNVGAGFGGRLVGNALTPDIIINHFLTADESVFPGNAQESITNVNVGNPRFGGDAGTRGTWLGKLVVQSLSNPCQEPPPVP